MKEKMKFKKLSPSEYSQLNDSQKEEYRSNLSTSLLIAGSHDHVDRWLEKFKNIPILYSIMLALKKSQNR